MSLKNPVTPPGIDPGTVRLVAQRLIHYATPGPQQCGYRGFSPGVKPPEHAANHWLRCRPDIKKARSHSSPLPLPSVWLLDTLQVSMHTGCKDTCDVTLNRSNHWSCLHGLPLSARQVWVQAQPKACSKPKFSYCKLSK
jgi:hypothetical protein